MATLRNVIIPALPSPPAGYDKNYFEKYNSALRLFMNGVTNAINSPRPYGSYYDTTTQTNPVANVANLITFNTVVGEFSFKANLQRSQIYANETGWYNIAFSLQADKTGGGAAVFYVWLRKNGHDVLNSARKISIDSATDESAPAWDVLILLAEGDYFEIAWSSPDLTVVFPTIALSAPVPLIPSAILTVSWVSGL